MYIFNLVDVMVISRMLVGWDSSKPQHGPYCLNIFLVRPRYFGHWMSPSKDMPIIVVWYYLFKPDYLFFICHPDWLNTLFPSNIHVHFNKTCKNHWSRYFIPEFQFRSWDPSHEHMVGVGPLCSPLIDGWRHHGAVGDNCQTQANNRILVLEKPSVAMSRTCKS